MVNRTKARPKAFFFLPAAVVPGAAKKKA